MFSTIVNFLNRHKRKLLFGGSFITGAFLLKKYAQQRLLEWHSKEALSLIRKQKKKHHYDKSKQSAQAAVLSMAEILSKIVKEELDSDSILQALHQKPSNKQSLWEELKEVAFSQILCSIYLSSLVVAVIHVKLMVLSGYSINKVDSEPCATNRPSFQELYMTSIQEFMEKGTPLMIRKIQRVVGPCVEKLSLVKLLNIEQLEMILHDITLELAGEFLGSGSEGRNRSRLRPWSQYCILPSSLENAPEGDAVKELLLETKDVIDSEDFNLVIEGLIQQGLNLVLDYVSESFPQPVFNNNELPVQLESTDEESLETPTHHLAFTKSTLPIAKLIPIFSGSVHNLLSLGPGHLLQTLLLNPRLEVFSNNVYSAFCTEESANSL